MKKGLSIVFAVFVLSSMFTLGGQPIPTHASPKTDDIYTTANYCSGTGLVVAGTNIRQAPSTKAKIIGRYSAPTYVYGQVLRGEWVRNGTYGDSYLWLYVPKARGYVSLTTMSFTCDW